VTRTSKLFQHKQKTSLFIHPDELQTAQKPVSAEPVKATTTGNHSISNFLCLFTLMYCRWHKNQSVQNQS